MALLLGYGYLVNDWWFCRTAVLTGIAGADRYRGNLQDNVHAFDNLAKLGIVRGIIKAFSIGASADEELAAVGIRTAVCHSNDTSVIGVQGW